MQAEIILLYIIIFLYGIVIGSFLNVLIYRIPLKEDIAIERSHCMTCRHKLQWYDLVPLFSFLLLRGKCRYCKAKISVQYPIVEAANGFGYVLIFAVNGFSWLSILLCLTYSCLIVISVIDERTFEIPVSLNISILILGIIRLIIYHDDIMLYIAGFFAVSLFMYIVLVIGRAVKGIDAFGGGDIKLMAVAGLMLGAVNVVLAFLIGCVLGALIHTIRIRVSGKEHMLAFGPYLSMGIFIAMLWGDYMVSWYMNLL